MDFVETHETLQAKDTNQYVPVGLQLSKDVTSDCLEKTRFATSVTNSSKPIVISTNVLVFANINCLRTFVPKKSLPTSALLSILSQLTMFSASHKPLKVDSRGRITFSTSYLCERPQKKVGLNEFGDKSLHYTVLAERKVHICSKACDKIQ